MSNVTQDSSLSPADTHFNYAQYLMTLNQGRAQKIAYHDGRGSLTYGELTLQIQRMASVLLAVGVRREERVLLMMQDCNDWPVSFLGAMYAGIVPVAVNTLLTAKDYAYMLRNSRSQVALISAPLLGVLQEALELMQVETEKGVHELRHIYVSGVFEESEQARWQKALGINISALRPSLQKVTTLASAAQTCGDDPGFWLYSSGSTGDPKGTLHTHANPYWTAKLYGNTVLGITENDIGFSVAKLFFAYGLGNALSFPLSVGATTVLWADRPTPQAVFTILKTYQATVFFGAPTGYGGMLASPDLPRRDEVALRLCSSAGEALPADIGERWTAHFGCHIVDGIGSTEMLHIYLSNTPQDVRYGTTGKPVPGYEVQLRREDGSLAEVGEIGDLYVKAPSAALMYWRNREKSNNTFQGEWAKSGDKYTRDADGYFTYAGRNDDMLKISGIYVSPFEVEATLVQHPSVLESAVIGVTDAEGLTKTKAFVVLKSGQEVSEAELQAFVKERLAPYKYPRQIEFIEELPKTATGKIQRFRLRDKEQAEQGE